MVQGTSYLTRVIWLPGSAGWSSRLGARLLQEVHQVGIIGPPRPAPAHRHPDDLAYVVVIRALDGRPRPSPHGIAKIRLQWPTCGPCSSTVSLVRPRAMSAAFPICPGRSRVTRSIRDEILVGLGHWSLDRRPGQREGVTPRRSALVSSSPTFSPRSRFDRAFPAPARESQE